LPRALSLTWVYVHHERVWQPEEHFFLVGFLFSSLFGTFRSMTFKRYGLLRSYKKTSSNLVINPTTCKSNRESRSGGRHNLSI